MRWLYHLGIFGYHFFIRFASLFVEKARLWVNGRRNWDQKLAKAVKPGERWVWFHCSSLGEFEDGRELLEEFRKQRPHIKILLTFFSPSGYEVRKNYAHVDLVMYMPVDYPRNAKKFIEILKPEIVFFLRSELWLNFITEVKKTGVPFYSISLELSHKSNFIKWPNKRIFRECFNAFTKIFCQNQTTYDLLKKKFALQNLIITGNTRFDRVYKAKEDPKPIPHIETFIGEKFCVISGSSLAREDTMILDAYHTLYDYPIQWIIVPHEIDDKNIAKYVEDYPTEMVRYSQIEKLNKGHRILWIDHVGDLLHLYKYTHFALIGGGFDSIAIHNILEPSVFGVPVAFGPNHRNFQEVLDTLALGSATVIHNTAELIELIRTQYEKPNYGWPDQKLINYVEQKRGATQKILDEVL